MGRALEVDGAIEIPLGELDSELWHALNPIEKSAGSSSAYSETLRDFVLTKAYANTDIEGTRLHFTFA